MPRTFIPLGEWLPDQGGFGNSGWVDTAGFIPSSAGAGSYHPAPGLGLIDSQDLAGNSFADPVIRGIHVNQSDWGTTDDYLYLGTASTTAADQILEFPLAGGSFTGRHAATASVVDSMWGWQFAGFGDITVATPGRGVAGTGPSSGKIPLYQSAPGATFAPLHDGTSDYEPSFRFCFPLGERLVIANLAGLGSSGSSPSLTPDPNPNMVWWSATNNVRKFWDEASAPADLTGYQFLYDDAGPITGGIGGRDFALIFKRSAVWRMDFGGAFGFTFRPVAQVGTLYHNSIVRVGADIYFWGPTGPAVMRYGQEYIPLAEGSVSRSLYDTGWPDYTEASSLGRPSAPDFSAAPFKLRGVWSQATGNVMWSLSDYTWLIYNVATNRFSYRRGYSATGLPTLVAQAPLDYNQQIGMPDVLWAGGNAPSGTVFLLADDVTAQHSSDEITHAVRTGFLQLAGEQRCRISGVRPILTTRDSGNVAFTVTIFSQDDVSGAGGTNEVSVENLAANLDRRGFVRTASDPWACFKSIAIRFQAVDGLEPAESIAEFDGIELEYELEGGGGMVSLRGQK